MKNYLHRFMNGAITMIHQRQFLYTFRCEQRCTSKGFTKVLLFGMSFLVGQFQGMEKLIYPVLEVMHIIGTIIYSLSASGYTLPAHMTSTRKLSAFL